MPARYAGRTAKSISAGTPGLRHDCATAPLGAAVRRGLPHHLFVYIFARGFFATLLASAAAGALALAQTGAPAGLSTGDLLLGRWLAAWGEAIVTGMLVAIFVAYRPQWLATYSDALYLPRRDHGPACGHRATAQASGCQTWGITRPRCRERIRHA